MKKNIAIFAMLVVVSAGFAQTSGTNNTDAKFTSAMEANLKILDSATTPGTYIALANSFERIGEADKKNWQPYYYAALCYAYMAVNVQDKAKIDPLIAKADEYLKKAILLSSSNSEILTLQAMLLNTKILVDPINRFQEYSILSAEYIKKAKELNPANPRPYLIEGRTKLFTPVAFGGGPEAARPVFEKAIALYKTFTPENAIAPKWGYSQAEKMLARVNENK
jgi:hypothetical protein